MEYFYIILVNLIIDYVFLLFPLFIFIVEWIILMLIIILLFILMAAFLTLFERQVLAAMQRRKGPNVIGFMGLLQAIADAVKLLFKERSEPIAAAQTFFVGASIFVVVLSLFAWSIIPLDYGAVLLDSNTAFLYFLSISGLSVYGVIVAGWSSSSRYPFLGALRACAQLLSYELAMSASLLIILFAVGSLNPTDIVEAQSGTSFNYLVFITLPLFPIWFICTVAETYRAPFDLAEAESELVSGFNVEYSGMTFAFLFLGEYLHIIVMSNLMALVFFGGWLPPQLISGTFIDTIFLLIPGVFWQASKACILIFSFIWVRATFPRLRYDQLMSFGWKYLLPFVCMLLWAAIGSTILDLTWAYFFN